MRSRMPLRFAAAVLVFAVVAGFMSGFFVSTAQALPSNEVDREYYAEAAHINLIGERLLLCNGQRYSWGSTSAYVITYSYPCYY